MAPAPLPPPLSMRELDPMYVSPSWFGRMRKCALSGVRLQQDLGKRGDPWQYWRGLPPGPAAYVGSVIHRVLQWARRAEPQTGMSLDGQLERQFARELAAMEDTLAERPTTQHLVPLSRTMTRREWGEKRALMYSICRRLFARNRARRTFVEQSPAASVPAAISSMSMRRKLGPEYPIKDIELGVSGAVDLVEAVDEETLEIREYKTGSILEPNQHGELVPRAEYVDQLRLYALAMSKEWPDKRLRLVLVGADDEVVVPWDEASKERIRLSLEELRESLHRGLLASPGPSQCRPCPRRHRCSEYIRTAPQWWTMRHEARVRPPLDIWGTVLDVAWRPTGWSVRLMGAHGYPVSVTGLDTRHGLDTVQPGEILYFFNLEPSGMAYHSPTAPRNYHECRPGEHQAWALALFRGAPHRST